MRAVLVLKKTRSIPRFFQISPPPPLFFFLSGAQDRPSFDEEKINNNNNSSPPTYRTGIPPPPPPHVSTRTQKKKTPHVSHGLAPGIPFIWESQEPDRKEIRMHSLFYFGNK